MNSCVYNRNHYEDKKPKKFKFLKKLINATYSYIYCILHMFFSYQCDLQMCFVVLIKNVS